MATVKIQYEVTHWTEFDLDAFIDEFDHDYDDWLQEDEEFPEEDTKGNRVEFLKEVLLEDPNDVDYWMKKFGKNYDVTYSLDVKP